MPINITQSQNINLDNSFVQGVGSYNFSEEVSKEINALLIERAEAFKVNWEEILNRKKIIASGDIQDVDYEVVEYPSKVVLNITYPYYAKFVDKGVKGALDESNAPQSPYKFKNTYKMSKEGRESIKRWLSSAKGKVKTTDVKKYGAQGVEKKFKRISELDRGVNRTIFLIKAYGIKTRDFIDPTIKKTLQGFEQELGEAIGKTITINIFR